MAYIKHIDEKLKNVAEQRFEIIDYLKRYEENAKELLDFEFPEDNSNCYIKTTFITWDITLEKIKQNKYGQQALEVLETIAYFAPDNIPVKIFLELAKGDIEEMGSILSITCTIFDGSFGTRGTKYSSISATSDTFNVKK